METQKERPDWDDLLTRYKKSAQTQKAYCKENSISLGTFQYHLNKARKLNKPAAPSGFSHIALKRSALSEQAYTIVLPTGVKCVVPTGFETEEVSRLLEVLVRC